MSRRRSVASARRKVIGVTYTYDFAGTTGAAWASPWTAVSGTVDIQSGKGRTETAAVAYESAVSHYNAVMPGDFELLAHPTITTVAAGEFYGIMNVRAGSSTFTDIRQHSSWNLRFYGGVGVGLCELYRVDASGAYSPPTALAQGADIDFVQGSVLHVRVRVVGGNIKVRYWKNVETEPSTWQIDFDDPTAPMGTSMSVAIRNGVDAVADRWDWDDISFVSIASGPASGTVARTLGNVTVAALGTGSSSAFDAPTASAIAGMSATPYKDYDWQGGTLHGDWNIVDGDDTPNGELSASRPSNVTFIADASVSSGFYMRCTMRQESYAGQPYSGVQMENFYGGPLPGAGAGSWRGYGQGSPFYVEVRLKWTGFDGFWCGPWMYDLGGTNSEIDIMETVNTRQPWTTLHPYGWNDPQVHVGAGYAATNDGQWHRYGLRVDYTGVYRYFDNVLISSYTDTTHAAVFVNANMGFKFQAFVGGSWPDSDAGHTTPQSGTPFPQVFDCDWVRLYRVGSGVTTWQVPAQGTLQQVADVAQPGDTIMVSGVNSYSGKILHLNNRDNGANPITVIGNPGNILRGATSGIEGYGSNRGWHFVDLNVEVHGGNNAPFASNSAQYGEGIYFGGDRADQGGDGQGCANIRVIGCTVKPIAGTGTIQRAGVSVWGCDGVEIGNCYINDVGYNDLGGVFGGAGSGISVGHSIRHAATPSFANGTRVWIHQNTIRNVIGPGTASADRNGLIIDLFHGSTDGSFYTNRSIGKILIEGNDIANCEGRGIQILVAGAADSQVEITANLVRAPIATNLGGSEPIAGIGGYGVGICGNVVCNNNDVTVSSGAYAYSFFSFDGAMDASISGVRGSGNVGQPRNFSGAAPGF